MDKIEKIADAALIRASLWLAESLKHRSAFEIKFGQQVRSMLTNTNDKQLLIELLDRSFRSTDYARSVEQVKYTFNKYGIAEFFSPLQKFLIKLFIAFGGVLPSVSMPFFIRTLRDEVKEVVLKGEQNILLRHIARREGEAARINLNFIGEAVLGENEAEFRRLQYIRALETPEIKYISIKASTIFSQISSLGYADTLDALENHLERIYKAARDNTFINAEGSKESKFVCLDMEEYRDMEIVYVLFMRILSKEEFKNFSAGIVVQAYIPDSHHWLLKLTDWAKERVAAGGAPIKVRIVKGANMEMEYIESSSKHWQMVTYEEKAHTDANYKKYILHCLSPEVAPAVHTGVASHNLFDLAFAYETAILNNTLEYVQFESLEGMAESIRQTLLKEGLKTVVYCTSAKRENFTNAIAYLVRRLDENTGEKNFLRYSFGLTPDDPAFSTLKNIFLESVHMIEEVGNLPKRTQDRNAPVEFEEIDFSTFKSEIDTDFVLPQNRRWAEEIADVWSNYPKIEYGSVIGGVEELTGEITAVYDKSTYPDMRKVGEYHLASAEALKRAVDIAEEGFKEWSGFTFEAKLKIFEKAINLFRKSRNDLLGIAAAEVGKVFTETDVEVSEAIDFIYFYTHAMYKFKNDFPHLNFKGRGIGVVISPWNFPVAIPTGAIMTALMSGNSVIFKPASLSTLTGRELCEIFWEAGVPKSVLQFIAARGGAVEEHIIKDKRVDFAVFTGSESTAYKILAARPELLISAETGGKDGVIATNLSDRDQAVKNILHSAFSNSGQKCSAASLLVLEEALYNDDAFKETLKDAVESIKVGSPWQLSNKLSVLSDLPSGALKAAVEDKDNWLVPPVFQGDNPYMLRPAVKWGVERGSFFHMTELFGPILSVMKAKNLKDAVDIVNETGYGLTAGLESLDEREWGYFSDNLKAGNLYINRVTTGAIVLRQPFGGMRKSCVGLGRKAGTYNYVAQFTDIEEDANPERGDIYDEFAATLAVNLGLSADELKSVSAGYILSAQRYFSKPVDYMKVRGEDNLFRYLPVKEVVIRYYDQDSPKELAMIILAVRSLGIKVTVSADDSSSLRIDGINVASESEEDFYRRFEDSEVRFRYLSQTSIKADAYKEIYAKGGFFAYKKVMQEGRFELLNYLLEQVISTSYHRYGNLGNRK
ncbi:MAG: bifunctional proline dehydrogenase/L-glutamate gamma-semialdehyde dehydrogenase [Deferribacteraceae bacterium]|nr:bifunctional proline dehydrogenase/L-glutamate gamma-semialdehyde dehydrogenase [Deferribacteraceae bacterium]